MREHRVRRKARTPMQARGKRLQPVPVSGEYPALRHSPVGNPGGTRKYKIFKTGAKNRCGSHGGKRPGKRIRFTEQEAESERQDIFFYYKYRRVGSSVKQRTKSGAGEKAETALPARIRRFKTVPRRMSGPAGHGSRFTTKRAGPVCFRAAWGLRYGSMRVPRTFRKAASHSGWAGHAGAVTRFPSVWDWSTGMSMNVPPAVPTSGPTAG